MEKMMKVAMLVVLVAVVVMSNEVVVSAAQSGSFCKMTAADMMECKPAVSGKQPAAPTPACCKALSNADIPCLCGYKNSNYLTMFGIDPNLAVQLPAKCNMPSSTC